MDEQTQAAVDGDLLCWRCDYNLRGLTLDDLCPECGAAVRSSFRGDMLDHSDPVWVARLQVGAFIYGWNLLIGTGLLLGSLLIYVLPRESLAMSFLWHSARNWNDAVVAFAGIWLLTMQRPGSLSGRGVELRVAARILAGVILGLYLIPMSPRPTQTPEVA